MAFENTVGVSAPAKRGLFGRMMTAIAVTAVASLMSVGLVVPSASADSVPAPGPNNPETATADPLPTVQINGIVWAQAATATKVYAGGEFTSARPAGAPAGTSETPRTNLLAYNLATGTLDTSFNPSLNGRVLAVATSPDGSRVYIGGTFTSVNGAARYRVAAFDTATGNLISNWAPGTNGLVQGIAATNSTVYIVGEFSNANNTARTRAAAFDAQTGALLPFNPVLEGGWGARAVVVSPDGGKVVLAGSFLTTNGSDNPGRGIAAVDAASGATLPWAMNSVIRNAGDNAAMYSLASDGDSVYGSGYDFGGSKTQDDFEGSFRASWSDGSLIWMEDCHGDTYSVHPFQGALYTAAHTHYCGNIGEFPQLDPWYLNHSLAFSKEPSDRKITPDIWGYRSFTGQTAGKLLHWYPIWATGNVSGIAQAGWSVAASGDYLLYGGEFTAVNGVRQQGLVRFAKKSVAPNNIGPTQQGGVYKIKTLSFRPGEARVSWAANYDADNATLKYEVLRQGTATPLYTTTADSTYWQRPNMTFADKNLTPGATYNYRVRVTDPLGNSTVSDWTPVTVATTGSSTTYDETVLDDQPKYFWPLNETSGSAGFDWVSGNDMTVRGSATRNVAGQEVGGDATATSFSGSSSSFMSTGTSETGPQQFSVEAWFKTSSTGGGKIVGFGNRNTGTSSSYDRHIYMNGSGAVTFGVYPGGTRTITSGTGYNNNQWHHVVGTLGPDGMALYIDGKRIGTDVSTTSAENYVGYWRVGGDAVGSWPSTGNQYLNGTVADVAVYDKVLTRDQVDAHWTASGRASNIPAAPADAYGKAVYSLDPTLYWRLSETSGTTANDSGKDAANGVYQTSGSNSIARNQAGALTGVSNPAIRFTSSKNILGTWSNRQTVVSQRQYSNPRTFAIEGWFKTTSTGGGKLIGFGSSNSNNANASSNYDRHVYMNGSGQLMFGVYNGESVVLTAPGTYRDGGWHHVVAQQSASGMQLYVDGALVASNSVTTNQEYNGYWRVGGDTTWEGDPFWVGTIDEVAIYGAPLTDGQVAQHYQLGVSGAVNELPVAQFSAIPNDLAVAFDASASSDAEGPIAAYTWDFGDGTTGTGVSPNKTYSAGGTYDVTLTVRDSGNLTASVTHPVTVQAPNQLPTAAFTTEVSDLTVEVDASTSTDPDGSIQTYSWNFGDGTTKTGEQTSHTYATAGTKTITLTVTDDRGGSDVEVTTVTVTAPPVPNTPPTASFTAAVQADGMTVDVDGSGSSDGDGTIQAYEWTFDDGGTATGPTASHSYTEPGTYTITLTVRDDDGATASTTRSVSVAPPSPEDVVAKDGFERTASNGWGSAEIGGAWTALGGSAAFSVAGGKGLATLAPSHTREARLSNVSGTDAVMDFTVSSNVASAGGTLSITAIARQVGSNIYQGRVRLEPNGVIRLYILRGETPLDDSFVLPGAYVPGEELKVRVSVRGTSPTSIAAKVWRSTGAEPSNWQLSATDSTSALQEAGFVSLKFAVSSVSTVPSTVVSVDDFKVVTGDVPAPPAPNQPPVAAFTSSVNGLTATFTSTSTDSDGTIASYAWEFGDGATSTAANPSHPYVAPGTYPVKLTVTDDDGASHSTTAPVVVNAPPPANVLASDEFDRTLAGSWGSADVGGNWTVLGGAAAFSVAGGKGVVTLAPADTREARLNGVSGTNAVIETTFSSDVASMGGTVSITAIGRLVGSSTYSGRVRLEPNGVIRLYILRDEAVLGGNSFVLPTAYTAGTVLHLKVAVTGSGTTTVAGKVWVDGTPEPASWQLQGTDSTAALQTAGVVSIKTAVSSVSANPTTRLSFESLTVTTGQ